MNLHDMPCILDFTGGLLSDEEQIVLCIAATKHLARLEADSAENVTVRFKNKHLEGKITYKGRQALHMIHGNLFSADLGFKKGEHRKAEFILPAGAQRLEDYVGPVLMMKLTRERASPTRH